MVMSELVARNKATSVLATHMYRELYLKADVTSCETMTSVAL